MPRLTPRLVPALALMTALALAVTACDSGDEAALPTRDELLGLWVNVDADRVRAFEFEASVSADLSPALAAKPYVYTIYGYDLGASPTYVQQGHYEISEGHLVTTVAVAPADPSQLGERYANEILGFSGETLTLQSDSAASGRRVFTRVETLP